jgi:TPR repeat protein
MYENGNGVSEDPNEAIRWTRLAAEQGLALAQYHLGLIYGDDMSRNAVESVNWIRLAAEQGLAQAEYHLGLIYSKGIDVPQDDVEAAKWFQLSEEHGYLQSKFHLNERYKNNENKNSIAQNETTNRYLSPAQQGEKYVQSHEEHEGRLDEQAVALRRFRFAVEKGDVDEQFNLGLMYENGDGALKNLVLAYAIFNVMADHHDQALKEREHLEKIMLLDQITAAQVLSLKFQATDIFLKTLDEAVQQTSK